MNLKLLKFLNLIWFLKKWQTYMWQNDQNKSSGLDQVKLNIWDGWLDRWMKNGLDVDDDGQW